MKKTSLKGELVALVKAPFEPGLKKIDIQPGITLRRDDHYFLGDENGEKITQYYLSFGSFYGRPVVGFSEEVKAREPLWMLDEITDLIFKFYRDAAAEAVNNIYSGYRG